MSALMSIPQGLLTPCKVAVATALAVALAMACARLWARHYLKTDPRGKAINRAMEIAKHCWKIEGIWPVGGAKQLRLSCSIHPGCENLTLLFPAAHRRFFFIDILRPGSMIFFSAETAPMLPGRELECATYLNPH